MLESQEKATILKFLFSDFADEQCSHHCYRNAAVVVVAFLCLQASYNFSLSKSLTFPMKTVFPFLGVVYVTSAHTSISRPVQT